VRQQQDLRLGKRSGGNEECNRLLFDLNQITPASFEYDFRRVPGHSEVPMLRVLRTFDRSEILMLAAASILVIGITFLF
jgi:hypothetical protein